MLEADAGKVFMIGISGKELDKETREILNEIKPGFIILFSRNVDTPEQVQKLVYDVSDFLDYSPIFAVDQEGGSVLRLKNGFSTLPSAMACAATGDPELIKAAVNAMSLELKAVGIDFNLAPVVDINTDPYNPVIGTRSYSDDANVVVKFAAAFSEGSKSARVMTCLKHFPGLGSVSVDPHHDLPVVEKFYEELYSLELIPFGKLNADALMPSHVFLPKIQKDGLPASLSKEVVGGLARNKLGFKGLIVSDDLLMGGVSKFSIEDRIRLAFDAGNDVLVICHEPDLQLRAFKYFKEMIKEDHIIKNKFTKVLERIMPLIHDVQHEDRPSMDLINCQEHRQIMKTVVEKSITVVRQEKLELPLRTLDIVLTMVGPPFSPVSDNPEDKIPSIVLEVAKQFGVDYSWFSEENIPNVESLKDKSIILFTYDAYRSDVLRKFIKELDNRSNLFLVALRNPYDALLVKNSLATYGSLDIQQKSIIDVFTGRITPTGTLPLKRREVVL